MGESDTANPRVKDPNSFDRYIRVIQQVGFPIVVASFLLWEWHTSVNKLNDVMNEVRILLTELRGDFRRTPGGNPKD